MSTLFVTGGTRGIGAAVAVEAARLGMAVAIGGRDAAAGQRVVEQAKAAGAPDALYVSVDVSQPAQLEAAFETIEKHFGRCADYYVASAGTGGPSHKAFYELSAAELQRVVDVNYSGAANLARLGWRALRTAQRSGAIVLISSIGAGFNRRHARYIPLYAPTKAAVDHLVRALALPALEDGVRIYGCSPGVTATDMGRGVKQSRFPHDTLEDFAAAYNPGGLAAEPEDVARCILGMLMLKPAPGGETAAVPPPTKLAAVQPGDCIACFGRKPDGSLAVHNMGALYSTMAGDDADAIAAFRGGNGGEGLTLG